MQTVTMKSVQYECVQKRVDGRLYISVTKLEKNPASQREKEPERRSGSIR